MLQNAAQTTQIVDVNILIGIFSIVGTIVGAIIGAIVSYILLRKQDIDKEKKRKQEEFDKIIHNIWIELKQNSAILGGNIDVLKAHTESLVYLKDELWKQAVPTGLLRYISSKKVYADLIVIYASIEIHNQRIVFRNSLVTSDKDLMKKTDSMLLDLFETTLKEINETLPKLEEEVLFLGFVLEN